LHHPVTIECDYGVVVVVSEEDAGQLDRRECGARRSRIYRRCSDDRDACQGRHEISDERVALALFTGAGESLHDVNGVASR
jgi:hypothetical protein